MNMNHVSIGRHQDFYSASIHRSALCFHTFRKRLAINHVVWALSFEASEAKKWDWFVWVPRLDSVTVVMTERELIEIAEADTKAHQHRGFAFTFPVKCMSASNMKTIDSSLSLFFSSLSGQVYRDSWPFSLSSPQKTTTTTTTKTSNIHNFLHVLCLAAVFCLGCVS